MDIYFKVAITALIMTLTLRSFISKKHPAFDTKLDTTILAIFGLSLVTAVISFIIGIWRA